MIVERIVLLTLNLVLPSLNFVLLTLNFKKNCSNTADRQPKKYATALDGDDAESVSQNV